jgi:hypothetical protein
MATRNPHTDDTPPGFGDRILPRRKAPGPFAYMQNEPARAKQKDIKKPKPQNMPRFPGEYEIYECNLYSPHKKGGGFIDLRLAFSEISIYESLFSSSLTMQIKILDGTGLAEFLPIIGEETLTLKIKTANMPNLEEVNVGEPSGPPGSEVERPGPFKGSTNSGLLDLTFSIFKMTDRRETSAQKGITEYTLHGVSKEYITSLKTKVQRTTVNTRTKEPQKISTVVRQLYREFFRWSTKKIFIEPTKNLTNMIIPNLTPFKAFDFLASRSVSAGQHAVGATFLFYETVTGFFFISIETLFAGGGMGYMKPADDPPGTSPQEGQYSFGTQRSKETYTMWPKRLQQPPDTKVSAAERTAMEMVSVDNYEFTSNFDVLENLTKGMYANKLLTHDLVRMKYDTTDFNYIDRSIQRKEKIIRSDGSEEEKERIISAADKKNFADGFAHLDKGSLCTDYQHALGSSDAHVSFYPTNFGHSEIPHFKNGIGVKTVKEGDIMGPLNIIPNRVEQWMQQRIVQTQQLNNVKVFIRAPGRSNRMVGDVIDFKIPAVMDVVQRGKEKPKPDEHKYLSGKYLVTKLRHHFTPEKYLLEFECIKDSLKSDLITGSEETQAEKSGQISLSQSNQAGAQ